MASGPEQGFQGEGSEEAISILESVADDISLAAHSLQSFEKANRK
jgi:hypothetical protein